MEALYYPYSFNDLFLRVWGVVSRCAGPLKGSADHKMAGYAIITHFALIMFVPYRYIAFHSVPCENTAARLIDR